MFVNIFFFTFPVFEIIYSYFVEFLKRAFALEQSDQVFLTFMLVFNMISSLQLAHTRLRLRRRHRRQRQNSVQSCTRTRVYHLFRFGISN